jgi:soluble cytochrome b562
MNASTCTRPRIAESLAAFAIASLVTTASVYAQLDTSLAAPDSLPPLSAEEIRGIVDTAEAVDALLRERMPAWQREHGAGDATELLTELMILRVAAERETCAARGTDYARYQHGLQRLIRLDQYLATRDLRVALESEHARIEGLTAEQWAEEEDRRIESAQAPRVPLVETGRESTRAWMGANPASPPEASSFPARSPESSRRRSLHDLRLRIDEVDQHLAEGDMLQAARDADIALGVVDRDKLDALATAIVESFSPLLPPPPR